MFRQTAAALIRYGGSTSLEAVAAPYANTIVAASADLERRCPRIVEAKIQGSTAHPSKKDPSDTKEIITVGYHTESGTRVLTIHAHDDGTWKEFMTRTGQRILEGK